MTAKALGIAFAVSLALGCSEPQPSEGAANKGQPAAARAPAASTGEGAARAASTAAGALGSAQMDTPAGWEARAERGWALHQAADRRAHLALRRLDPGDAVAARVADALGAMGGSAPSTAEEQPITIGPDKLPARAASGSCRLGAAEARLQYAVVDVAPGEQVIAVFTAAKDAPEEAQRTAFTALATLRRR